MSNDARATAPFWPFFFSPAGDDQMAAFLVDQPSFGAPEPFDLRGFRDSLFAGTAHCEPGDTIIRTFAFGEAIAFAAILTTEAVEAATGRTGLKLAFGFAVSDRNCLETEALPVQLMGLMLEGLNEHFGSSLPETDAARIIERLTSADGPVTLELEGVRKWFAIAAGTAAALCYRPGLRLRGRLQRLWWRLTPTRLAPPRCILVFSAPSESRFLAAFRALTREYIVRLHAPGGAGFITGEAVQPSDTLIRCVGQLAAHLQLSQSEIVQSRDGAYIALY